MILDKASVRFLRSYLRKVGSISVEITVSALNIVSIKDLIMALS
jgi:hypothetical protein